jgi:CO/xanthine dehydrogenase FAD-binding subunit
LAYKDGFGGAPAIAKTLRDVANFGFMQRERVRFTAGRSELLGVTIAPKPGDGFLVDVSAVEELRQISVAPNGTATVGAFVTPAQLAVAVPAVCPVDATPVNIRLRLALHDARVTVCGLGRTRVAPLDALQLAPYELPATIEVPAPRAGLGIAERRLVTHDGDASFAIEVTVALRISLLARFEHVRIFVHIDGEARRATEAETKLERQRCDRDLFPEAARLAAMISPGTGTRSSAIARALPPLVLASLREAFALAKVPAR